MGLAEIIYSNEDIFLVHKSGALRRTELGFAKSELGKLSYVELDISRMVG